VSIASHFEIEKELTAIQVALWWGFAEARSPRWRKHFEPMLGTECYRDIQYKTVYALSVEECKKILKGVNWLRGGLLDRYVKPASRHCFVFFPTSRLGDMHIMRELGQSQGMRLKDYLLTKHDPVKEWDDPRAAARQLNACRGLGLMQGYPVLGWDKALADYVLIDGYTRCLARLLRPAEERMRMIACMP